jgi:recombination protein RecT
MANKIQNQVANINNQPKTMAQQSASQIINSLLDGEKMRARFNEILGARTPQFISSIVAVVNADTSLQKALYESPMTIIQAGLKAAVFDLPIDPSLGYAYIAPFNNSKKQADGTWTKKAEATFMLGWKGMHQLALRTGAYKTINVIDIREGELKSYNRLTEEVDVEFIDDEIKRESLPVVGYLGYYKLVNGAEKTIYMSVDKIKKHEEKFRKGKEMGKGWRDDWDAMARKTVYRQLIGKWGVMSIEYQRADVGASLAQQLEDENKLDNNFINAETIEVDGQEVNVETGEVNE